MNSSVVATEPLSRCVNCRLAVIKSSLVNGLCSTCDKYIAQNVPSKIAKQMPSIIRKYLAYYVQSLGPVMPPWCTNGRWIRGDPLKTIYTNAPIDQGEFKRGFHIDPDAPVNGQREDCPEWLLNNDLFAKVALGQAEKGRPRNKRHWIVCLYLYYKMSWPQEEIAHLLNKSSLYVDKILKSARLRAKRLGMDS